MFRLSTERILKTLFKSSDKQDWASRDSWRRRAIYWKLMSRGLSEFVDPECPLIKTYSGAMKADQERSPSEKDIILFVQKVERDVKSKRAQDKSKIILP